VARELLYVGVPLRKRRGKRVEEEEEEEEEGKRFG
jgi:hypothetical protein